jgi:hypothetical protein
MGYPYWHPRYQPPPRPEPPAPPSSVEREGCVVVYAVLVLILFGSVLAMVLVGRLP